MEYVLAMTFATERGGKSNFSISGIKPDLTPAQVNALMDTIISKNIFTSSTGTLATKAGASITERNVTKIEIV